MFFDHRLARVLGAGLLGAGLLTAAGCTTSSHPTASTVLPSAADTTLAPTSVSEPVSTPATSVAAPVTTSATSSAPPAPVSTAPTTSAPRPKPSSSAPASASAPATLPIPSPSATSASPVPGPGDGAAGCLTSALSIRALRASGAAGHQYAFLQFTNTSSSACSLTGFPGVQLMRGGVLVGKPAVRSDKAADRVRIAPGSSVTAQVVDDSSCNADKSDAVQIIVPNRTDRVVVPLAVRACSLTVDPVTPS